VDSLSIKLGRTIRQLRKGAGYSQEAFADHVGVHRTYMGTVERGETNMTIENVDRIARGLGLTAGQLVLRAEEGGAP